MILALGIAATLVSATASRQEAGGATRAPEPRPAAIALEPVSGSGVLRIKSPLLPDDALELVGCETVLDGLKDFGMYPLKLEPGDWKIEDGRCSWSWTFKQGFQLDFSAAPEADSVLVKYTLRNDGKEALERVQVILCLPTMGAPTFYPGTPEEARQGNQGRKARTGRHDYTQLYERAYLWSKGQKFTFASAKLGRDEKHIAFMRQGEEPFQWSWFVNSEETFDVPLLAIESHDKKHALALGFEKAIWTCTNCGDGRACVHLFPYLGRIAPGKSVTVAGRIYLMEGGPDDVLARFKKDFPKAQKD